MSIRAVAAAAVLTLQLCGQAFAQDSGTWRDFMPPKRRGAALVHDTHRDRYVMFGGKERLLTNDLWVLPADSAQWRPLATVGVLAPVPRVGAAALYDPLHDRIWVYGGEATSALSGTFWALDADPEEWVLVTQQNYPGNRSQAGLVQDPARDRILLFGGMTTLLRAATNEVSWIAPYSDSPQWAKLNTSGTPPAARWGAIVAFDRLRDRMVVIGGRNRDSVFTDAWQLSFSPVPTWSRIVTVGDAPPKREGALGVLDASHDRIVTFGGLDPATDVQNRDVWTFALSGFDAWTLVDAPGSPDALVDACAVMDSARARIVIQGGGRPQSLDASYASNETRTLDVAGAPTWGRITPLAPQPRYGAGAALDLPHDAFWIFGGLSSKDGVNDFSNELWRGSLTEPGAWTPVAAQGPAPAGRHEPSLTYDARANRLYLFGGRNSTDYFGDTWTFDLAGTWRPVAPSGGPKPRRAQATAWDTSRRALFIFGGTDGDSTFGDAWELSTDGSIAWRRIDAEGEAPAPRGWASAIYDPRGDRVIVYGGLIDGKTQDDVWALSLGTTPHWTRLEPGGESPTRARHAAVYDPARRRMLVWGGFKDDGQLRSSTPGTWALALDGDPVWTKLATTGSEPPPATAPAVVFDVRRDRLVTYAGSDVLDDLYPDLRALEFGGAGNAGESWLEGARVEGTSVRIAWQTLASPGTVVAIEKRVDVYGDELRFPFAPPVGTWATATQAGVAADGGVAWTDSRVGGGGSYSYRLNVGGQASEVASVNVPVTATFALESALPSPTTGPLVLAIRSTGVAPVWASLYDASGRRVMTRELGVLPAGVQSVPLELGLQKAGIYFVRVSQGGNASTRKIVLL